jgi:2,3-bisphosphoglycerate-dependent phosphoglycerate mutase
MMPKDDARHPTHDPRYRHVNPSELPSGESLKDTVARFLPLWKQELAPRIQKGERLLLVAHGNSLRALIQYLEGLTPDQIMEVNVPTGIPLLYELDADLKVIKKEYLGEAETVQAAMETVSNQGKAKPK